jgi:hypothetical protein
VVITGADKVKGMMAIETLIDIIMEYQIIKGIGFPAIDIGDWSHERFGNLQPYYHLLISLI